MRSSRLSIAAITALAVLATLAVPVAAQEGPTETVVPPPSTVPADEEDSRFGADDEEEGQKRELDAAFKVEDGKVLIDLSGAVGDGAVKPVPLPTWMLACRWVRRTKREHFRLVDIATWGTPTRTPTEPDEPWVAVVCPPNVSPDQLTNLRVDITGVLEAWPVTETPPAEAATYVIHRAWAEVAVPTEFGESSPPGDDQLPMITQLDTWLWLDDNVLGPRHGTASILDGALRASVTVTPIETTFTGGLVNGYQETVTCTLDQMKPYNLNIAEDRQHTACKILYRHRTNDSFLSTTIRYQVNYTCNTLCGSGQLPDMYVNNTRPVTVNEILVKNTGG